MQCLAMDEKSMSVTPTGWTLPTKLWQSVSNSADEATEGFFGEVLGMLEAFGRNAKRSNPLSSTTKDGLRPQQSGANTFQARRHRYG